jgi:hypothetical protein
LCRRTLFHFSRSGFPASFFTTGTAVVFPFYVFVWLLLIVKAKINKQTNKQKKSGSCQFARRYSHQRHAARLSSFFILQDRRRKGKKKCVTTLFYIIQIRSHGLPKENDWNRFKFARNPAGDE